MARRRLDQFPELLTAEELGEFLGLSKKTAYKMLRTGVIKSIKAGREYRVPKAHIMAYLQIPYQAK